MANADIQIHVRRHKNTHTNTCAGTSHTWMPYHLPVVGVEDLEDYWVCIFRHSLALDSGVGEMKVDRVWLIALEVSAVVTNKTCLKVTHTHTHTHTHHTQLTHKHIHIH